MRRYSKSDVIDMEVRRLLARGWSYRRGSKHGRVISPDGKAKVSVPGTPSDIRSAFNFVRDVKRTFRRA